MSRKEYKTLILAFVLLFIGPGISFFSYSLFLPYLVDAYGWGRGVTTAGFTGYWFFMSVGSFLAGSLISPLGLRKVMLIGVAATGMGFLSLVLTTSPWHLVPMYGAVGIGVSFMGIIPVTTLLAHQFPSSMGKALGIAGIGMSSGGLIGSPLIERALTMLGWQEATVLLALATWIGGFLVLWISWPHNSLPTGTGKPWTAAVRNLTGQITGMKKYSKEILFWWVLLITFIGAFGQVSIMSHMVAHLLDLGVQSSRAALALSVTICFGILGKIVIGYVADQYNASLAMRICFLSQAAGLLIMSIGHGILTIVFFLCFFGFGMGPIVPLHAQWVMQVYGIDKFQHIFPTIRIASTLGAALGPVVTGIIFDISHSYLWAFYMIIVLYFAGTIILRKIVAHSLSNTAVPELSR